MFLNSIIILEVGKMEKERDFELSCIKDLIYEIKNTMCFLGKAFPDGIASYTAKCLELLVSSELDDINREIRFK